MNAVYCWRDQNREIRYVGETSRPLFEDAVAARKQAEKIFNESVGGH